MYSINVDTNMLYTYYSALKNKKVNIVKTYSVSSKDITRDWFVVDASNKILGRLASEIAVRLKGKHKPDYCTHLDVGDYIIVINASKIAVSGTKLDNKTYHRHSGFPGGLKSKTLSNLMKEKPTKAIELAVKGMLPKGPLGRSMFRKLKVYPGPTHRHSAQEPQTLDIG